jgi:ferredoxin
MHIVANDSEFDIDGDIALLSALAQQGICAQFSCRNGNCGLCEASLNAGRVWLDDKGLFVEAPATILLCRAYACSDLALGIKIAPRAVSRYCRVVRFEKNEHGYEVELQLPAGRVPELLPDDAVRLEADANARLIRPHSVSTGHSQRLLVLRLLEDDKPWLDAVSAGKGLRIMLPIAAP